jgi:hypothetical protein
MAFFTHPTLSPYDAAHAVHAVYHQEVYCERVGNNIIIQTPNISDLIQDGVFFDGEIFEVTPLTAWNHPRDAYFRDAFKRKLQDELDDEVALMDRPRLERSVAVPYAEVWGTEDGSP